MSHPIIEQIKLELVSAVLDRARNKSKPVKSVIPLDDSCKFYAQIMLSGIRHKIVIPTYEEWVGVNMLERDGELKRIK